MPKIPTFYIRLHIVNNFIQTFPLSISGTCPLGNPLSKTFNNSSFSNTKFSNEAGIVLSPPTRNFNHTFYLLLPSHSRIQVSLKCNTLKNQLKYDTFLHNNAMNQN